jgi:uncharacterized damage-inducible protein DinB
VTVAVDERPSGVTSQIHSSAGLGRLLDEFESLLATVPSSTYEAVPEGGGATIARLVGQCLDLIAATLSVDPSPVLVYQHRQETTGTDRTTGIRRIRALRESLLDRPERSLDGIVSADHVLWPLDDVERGWSTLGNELAFIVNRIADRQKIITRIMNAFGVPVPEGFGSMELQPLRARSSVPPSWALWRLLDELETLLIEVAPALYCARFAADVSGTIGEHVRHCLDHVSALLTADPSAALSYDRRHRGTAVETDGSEALRQIQQLKDALNAWSRRSLDEPVRVTSMISSSGDGVSGWSTLARELAFVVSHTIHHYAIIGVLLAVHGHGVPAGFGHSPATPRRH